MWTYNLQEHYLDQYYPWMGILSVAAFSVSSVVHILKGYIPVQLVFGRDMFIPTKHIIVNWKFIPQRKQAHIDYDNTLKIK